MRFRIYIRVEGKASDIAGFDLALRGRVAGSVLSRKHRGAPLLDVSLEYWRSEEEYVMSGHPEEAMLSLLQVRQPALTAALEGRDLEVTAVIVGEYSQNEAPRGGYFLSRELVHQLSVLGAQLDIDSVPEVS